MHRISDLFVENCLILQTFRLVSQKLLTRYPVWVYNVCKEKVPKSQKDYNVQEIHYGCTD